MTHLWEHDHPYYCAEGNYYKTGCHEHFESWQEFGDEATPYGGDRDQNLLIRWDWHSPRRYPEPLLRVDEPDLLMLHFVLQRKALLCSAGIAVTDDDEPDVRRFLEECGKTIAAIWQPVTLTSTST